MFVVHLSNFLQLSTLLAFDINSFESACDCVEASRINDYIKVTLLITSQDTVFCNALNRRIVNIDKLNVILVVDFIVVGFQRNTSRSKPMIFGISFSAVTGSFTRCLILLAINSLAKSFASLSTSISSKLPCQIPNPGLAYNFSQNSCLSSGEVSKVFLGQLMI